MKFTISIFLYSLIASNLMACATIFSGTTDKITIDSVPKGANVKVEGMDRGTTPLVILLQRSSGNPIVELTKDGYEKKTFNVETSFNSVAIANTIFWPFWLIDAVTGALHRYDQTTYSMALDPKTTLENR